MVSASQEYSVVDLGRRADVVAEPVVGATDVVVPTALFGTSHNYFETYQTVTPAEVVPAEPMETIPIEFSTELAELERPAIVPYSCELAFAHDRDIVFVLEYPSWGLMNESTVYSYPRWFFL